MNDQTVYLTPKELAARLHRPDGTLRNGRCKKFGPPWIKLGKQVLYPLAALEEWEKGRVGV